MTIAQVHQDVRTALCTMTNIGDRVFPIVATEGTAYPFVTIERTAIDLMGTKDGPITNAVTFEVHIVTATYMEGLSLVDEAVAKLTRITSSQSGTRYHVRYEGFSEQYVDGAYVQNITFTL